MPRKPNVSTKVQKDCSEKLENLSRFQLLRRKKKTVEALKPIHCASNSRSTSLDEKAVQDGLWTTIIGTTPKPVMSEYISTSKVCMDEILPKIVKGKVDEYVKSDANKVRSMRVLYEGGLISKRKYTSIRNSGDIVKQFASGSLRNAKSEIMKGCEIPKVIPYKILMSHIRNIDIGEVLTLESLAQRFSTEEVSGVYRPLKPFLLKLADLYLSLHDKNSCLHWFNEEKGVFYVAVGADGAPFGKDDTATAYLVSFLNLLQRVQSCNDNHLLLGANCEEDHPLMKSYTSHLREEMEQMEGKSLTTQQGNQVVFKFVLIPADMKWMSSHSGELNNCATYFSSFANVNQANKATIGGTIGGPGATWQPWEYKKRLEVAEKVENLKKRLKEPTGKHRGEVTKFIAQNKSRQEYVPPLGKYVDLFKAEPLHNTNNAWQHWFLAALAITMQYTNQSQLKSATVVPDLPLNSPLVLFLNCVRDTLKCGRLYKNFLRWFSEKRKKGIPFSYRFTGLESKHFCWNFASLIQQLLKINSLSKGSVVKLHSLAFVALKLRDAVSIYSRVEISTEQLNNLKISCQHYFNAYCLLLDGVTPTVWTIGVAIPYHTGKLLERLGYGLGLNSMQGREAKHIKLAKYVQNTCNVRKSLRWWTVFRHEFVSMVWLRERDPYSITYRCEKKNVSDSYLPKRIKDDNNRFCNCGQLKASVDDEGCEICTSDMMKAIKRSVVSGKITSELKQMF